jgi:diguanylate cyclase (GGDEF)-like protein
MLLFWASASAQDADDVIDLQLRWHHQFQFAGYYAALEKGFYRDAGLEVRIHPGAPGRTPVGEVLAGRAEYGEANSELLYQRLQGEPLVALAAIFQHSPSVLLTRGGIASPQDLAGKRVMLIGDVTDADLYAMFQAEGVDPSAITIQPSSYDVQDLISGRTDAFNSYLTNEPFYLEQRGIEYNVIEPRRYGIDFYSDVLFTTEQEIRDNPERVRAFREASLKGWQYAMEHPSEIIDLLREKYGVAKTRAHLEYEAATMRGLIMPDLVSIGHMNPGRWRHMADTFVSVGMVEPGYSLDGFIYQDDPEAEIAALRRTVGIALAVVAILATLTAIFYALYFRLRKEVRLRKAAEQRIRDLAYYDQLTGLPNRHLFYDRLQQAIGHARRNDTGFALCFCDLDSFKRINDQHGHMVGDRLLHEVAARVAGIVRKSDTVARFGGDEFVVLMHEVESEAEARRLGEMLLRAIRQPYEIDDLALRVSASIGISLFPQDEHNIRDLLHAADAAMYLGKQQGKDRLVFYRSPQQVKVEPRSGG